MGQEGVVRMHPLNLPLIRVAITTTRTLQATPARVTPAPGRRALPIAAPLESARQSLRHMHVACPKLTYLPVIREASQKQSQSPVRFATLSPRLCACASAGTNPYRHHARLLCGKTVP